MLASGCDPCGPAFLPCGDKPLAVVLDVDETSILNLGAEYDERLGPRIMTRRWRIGGRTRRGRCRADAGREGSVAELRAGVTVIFNTNRAAVNAAGRGRSDRRRSGPRRHGETLYLMGDDATGCARMAAAGTIAARISCWRWPATSSATSPICSTSLTPCPASRVAPPRSPSVGQRLVRDAQSGLRSALQAGATRCFHEISNGAIPRAPGCISLEEH